MTKYQKVMLTIALAILGVLLLPQLVVAGGAMLPLINNFLWQLSYLLPAWIIGPASLLGGILLFALFFSTPVAILFWIWRQPTK